MRKKKHLPKKAHYYLYSACIVLSSIVLVLALPLIISIVQSKFDIASFDIPKNSSNSLSVQKYFVPPISKNIPISPLTARAVYIKDLDADTILFQRNAHAQVPIASTTKIMSALVASEYFRPNSELVASQGAAIDGSSVGLVAGERLSFRSLLYGMLLNSGNDAAFTIAENYPGGVAGFVDAMNKKSKELGLINTHFDNPAGFDSPNHFSSASDLAIIAEESLNKSELVRIFSTKETEVISLDKTQKHKLVNLNKLLSDVKGVLGIKTGYTNLAKENLVGLVERDSHRILTIVLGSDDRFAETTALIEWVYKNFTWP